MRKSAKNLALVLAVSMIPGSAVFAAEGDHYVNGKVKYSSNQVRADVAARNHVRAIPSEFEIEVDGKLYTLAEANAAFNKDQNNWKEILKGETPVEGELKVVEVSAISGSQIEIKFSAAVTEADVVDSSSSDAPKNVTVIAVGTGSTAVGTLEASLSKDGKVLTIANSSGFKGLYSVEVTDDTITSKDNPAKKFKGLLTTIEIKDTVAPTVTGVTYDVTTATVKFSEPMSSVGTVSLDGVALISGTDYTAFTAGKDELEILNLKPGKTYTLSIVGAKDIAANFISPNPTDRKSVV